MRNVRLLLGAIVVACMVSWPVLSETPEDAGEPEDAPPVTSETQDQTPADKETSSQEKEQEQIRNMDLGDMNAMAEELHISLEQAKKIEVLVKKKQESIRKLEEAADRKRQSLARSLERARKKSDQARLQKSLDQLDKSKEKQQQRLEATAAPKIMAVLTKKQRADWNAAKLHEAMLEEFSAVSFAPEQDNKLKALCLQVAGGIARPLDVRYVPSYKASTAKQVSLKLLTKAQKRAYLDQKREERKREKEEDEKRDERRKRRQVP